jgi:hypothetical protein
MAIIPINSLPAIPTPVDGAAEIAAELSGVTYKVTIDQIKGVINTVSTTDATLTTLATIPLLDDTVYMLEVTVAGRRTDAADRASYVRRASVFREATGVATLNGFVTSGFTRESDSTWNVSLTVSGNNVLVQVTGAVGKDVNWKSSHRLVAVG